MRAKKLNDSGFSLVETMVAVAIVGIMSAASLTMFLNQNKQMALIQSKFGNMSLASDLRSTFESASLCKEAYVGDTLPAADASATIPLKFKTLSNVVVAAQADLSQSYQIRIESLNLTHAKLVGTNWAGHPIYSGVVVLQTQRPEKPLLFAPMVVGALFFETDKAGKVLSCANFPTFSDPFVPTTTPTPTPPSRYDSASTTSESATTSTSTSTSTADAAAKMATQLADQLKNLEKSVSATDTTSGSATSASTSTDSSAKVCTNGEARQSEGKCGPVMEICMNGGWYDTGLSGACETK